MTACAERVRRELRAAADPERAAAMAAYMKSAETGNLRFLGVRRPEVRRIVKDVVQEVARDAPADPAVLTAVVRELWDHAGFREERYAAQDLLALRWARGRLELLDLHRAHGASPARGGTTSTRSPTGSATSRSAIPTRWRRCCAPGAGTRRCGCVGWRSSDSCVAAMRWTSQLLADVIEPNVADPEFFVRKAIGWALRDVARHHPAWVRGFVATHELSPLSRREALRHLH